MNISIRNVILFCVFAAVAFIIDKYVAMPAPLKTVFRIVIVIVAILVLLAMFGVGPGVHVH
jgi:predicted acyltransferase